jgi:ABC-type multidrug transport system fused ATPase/permease subunit
MSALFFLPSILSSVVMATYIGTGHSIDLSTTFTVLVLLNIIKEPIKQLPYFLQSFISFRVSMKRIQQFLDIREVPLDCLVSAHANLVENELAVKISKKSFSWGVKHKEPATKSSHQKKSDKAKSKRSKMHRVDTETTLDMSMYVFTTMREAIEDCDVNSDEEPDAEEEQQIPQTLDGVITLKEIEFEAKQGEFVCIIGDVGSGKSSLLSALNGDMLYASRRLIKSYAGAEALVKDIDFSGLQSQMLKDEDLKKLQEKLVDDSLQAGDVPPVSLTGSVSLVQQSPWV